MNLGSSLVDADSFFASNDSQGSAVVKGIENDFSISGGAAPAVASAFLTHESFQFLWVHRAVLFDQSEYVIFFVGGLCSGFRMDSFPEVGGHEAVGVKKALFKIESEEVLLQVSCAIVLNPMAQDEVLRPSRTANGVGLHEAQALNRFLQLAGRKEAFSDDAFSELSESWHGAER